MRSSHRAAIVIASVVGLLAGAHAAEQENAAGTDDLLIGLWMAEVHFGPALRGEFVIRLDGTSYHASLAGREADCSAAKTEVRCVFPNGLGVFRGELAWEVWLDGWWLQPTGDSE